MVLTFLTYFEVLSTPEYFEVAFLNHFTRYQLYRTLHMTGAYLRFVIGLDNRSLPHQRNPAQPK